MSIFDIKLEMIEENKKSIIEVPDFSNLAKRQAVDIELQYFKTKKMNNERRNELKRSMRWVYLILN